MAYRLDAIPAMAAGLRILPQGAAIADALELPTEASAELLARVTDAPSYAHSLLGASDRRGMARVRFISRKLFPTPTFIRYRYGLEGAGRTSLAAAYARRWGRFIRAALPSARAWARVRRDARTRRAK
jgi:hypothetical protein